jgi:hypothetical protein
MFTTTMQNVKKNKPKEIIRTTKEKLNKNKLFDKKKRKSVWRELDFAMSL